MFKFIIRKNKLMVKYYMLQVETFLDGVYFLHLKLLIIYTLFNFNIRKDNNDHIDLPDQTCTIHFPSIFPNVFSKSSLRPLSNRIHACRRTQNSSLQLSLRKEEQRPIHHQNRGYRQGTNVLMQNR